MFNRNLPETLDVKALTASQAIAANGSSTVIDVSQYRGNMAVTLNIGDATAGTNPTLDAKVQTCATNNGTFVDVTGAAITQATAASLQMLGIDQRACKKYIKILYTIGGTSNPSFPVSATLHAQKQVQ